MRFIVINYYLVKKNLFVQKWLTSAKLRNLLLTIVTIKEGGKQSPVTLQTRNVAILMVRRGRGDTVHIISNLSNTCLS